MFAVPDHAMRPKQNGEPIGPPNSRANTCGYSGDRSAPLVQCDHDLRVARSTSAALVARSDSNGRDTDLAVAEVERAVWFGAFARLALGFDLLRRSGGNI